MTLIKKIKAAYYFPNGNLAVIDNNGNQYGELQGAYSIDKHKRILLEANDDCEFKGFDDIPDSMTNSAKSWANFFREKNMSFEEIQKL